MARYLLAASPLAGHVMPMLAIGAGLRRNGHDVTFLCASRYQEASRRRGMTAVPLPEAARPRPTPRRSTAWNPPKLIGLWRSGRADMRSVFIDPLVAQYGALRNALDSSDFDAVLVDVAFTGALPMLISDRSRPPVAVCGVGPLTLSSIDTPPFGIGWHPRPGVDYGAMNWFVQHVLFADVQARLNSALRNVGAGRSPVFLTDWPKLADRVLQLTVPATEYPRSELPSSVVFTGPVPAESVSDLVDPSAWRTRLQTTRTVVHVTQGTWDNRDHGQLIRPTLEALADRDDVLVVATTGLPDQPGFSGAVPRNAWITDYIPYDELLPHVDVMITNGGYGGVQQALGHGIPLILAGRTADKPEIAARIEFIGAGIDLKTDRPSAATIGDAVRRILSTDGYRDAARKVGSAMAETTPLETIAHTLAQLDTEDLVRPLASGS
jgi:UDP:flavonoid glycosyltransferase YjiC (YdhE family)